MSITLDQVRAMDAADPLGHLHDRFLLPDNLIYLDGNSLGVLPASTVRRQQDMVLNQWGHSLIRSWNDHGWIDAPQRVGAKIASLIGANPHEVIVADFTRSSEPLPRAVPRVEIVKQHDPAMDRL